MKYASEAKRLEQWALDNYDAGGHWAYETFKTSDYEEFVANAKGDYVAALADLQDWVRLTLEQEANCRFE
jgi:hypothetical protein